MKSKYCIAVVAALVLLAGGFANAQEDMMATAPLALVPVTLDGVMDPGEWDDALPYYFDASDPATNPGWAGCSAEGGADGDAVPAADWSCTFWLKHDGDYVYICCQVTDDVINNDEAANLWDDDTMEIYFDADNDDQSTKEGDETGFQISYRSDNGLVGGQGGPGAATQWWDAQSVIAPPGYVMELAVYKSVTGMVTGGRYGFDLSPDDDDMVDGNSDGVFQREHQYWWNARDCLAWNNEVPWGEIFLSPDPLATAPADPSNLTATAISSTMINLGWDDNSDNEEGFKIERSPTGTSGWTEIDAVGVDVETYTDMGLMPDTEYFYRVLAYNTVGDSAYSNVASARTQAGAAGPMIWDYFDYTDGEDLIGQNGGSGWTEAWSDRIGISTGKYTMQSGHAEYTAPDGSGWAAVQRLFPELQDGKTYYISWDMLAPDGFNFSDLNYKFYLTFFCGPDSGSDADEVINIGVNAVEANQNWQVRGHTEGGTQAPSTTTLPITTGVPHRMVCQLNLDGQTDNAYFWFNPDPSSSFGPDTALVDLDLNHGAAQEIDRISLDAKNGTGCWFDNFEVTTQPLGLRNFTAQSANQAVILTWNEPTTAVMDLVRIQRRDDTFPSGPNDGVTAFEGSGGSYIDTGLQNARTYYYMAFGRDHGGTWTEGVTATGVPNALDAKRWDRYR